MKKRGKSKLAVSLMVSYVLLVSISIIVGVGVFAWLKIVSNAEPTVDCKEGTSIVLNSISCNLETERITLNLKNNG